MIYRKPKAIIYAAVLIVLFQCLASCHSSKRSSENRIKGEVAVIKGNPGGMRGKVVDEALTWLGTPYAYARCDKNEGTDCSGMVMSVFETVAGWKLPRNSAKQAAFCKPLKKENVRVGDLAFFATGKDPDRISHVGIMIDGESFIHASTSKGVVVSKITAPYYIKTFKMFGRIPFYDKEE